MILAWHRKLVAQKFDGSKQRRPPGRPRVDKDLENWVVKMATENRLWGYDRIAGSLADSGYTISDQTVGNILKRRDVPTEPDRKKTTTWRDFIRTIIIHGVEDASVNWLVEEANGREAVLSRSQASCCDAFWRVSAASLSCPLIMTLTH
jgi:hypothetical protein